MKEQTYFHIPEPCHENWDSMTQQDKGRFCASCNKQVVDFSLMSDQQVLNYFKNATGKTCGRFANDQLQRPMIETPKQKKKVWWVAAMMPLLLLFGKANAQKKKIKAIKGEPALIIPDNRPEIMGKVAPGIKLVTDTTSEKIISTENCGGTMGDTTFSNFPNYLTIKGVITDAKTETPLMGASVLIKDSKTGIATDKNGNFTLSVKQNQKLPTIIISYVGFQTKEINLNKDGSEIISRINKTAEFEEITLKSEMLLLQEAYSGGVVIVSCKRPKRIDTAKTIIKKILKTQEFKIFPNPVKKGSLLKVEIKKAGDYSVQILDNNSALILVKDFHAINDNALMEIAIPSYITPGMYYLRLIDNNNKKQYTDKLIVQ